jgi:hypothetical protein
VTPGALYEGIVGLIKFPLLGIITKGVPFPKRCEETKFGATRCGKEQSNGSVPLFPTGCIWALLTRIFDSGFGVASVDLAEEQSFVDMGTGGENGIRG